MTDLIHVDKDNLHRWGDWSAFSPIVFLVILVVAFFWKIGFIIWGVLPFNADEAIVGLMARHILSGERPVFFYGQAYMGSLDAYLVAGAFRLFGESILAIRLVQSILYLGTIIITVKCGEIIFGSIKTGLLAGLLLAVPTINVFLYTTVSLGGYGEAMLIGSAAFWASLVMVQKRNSDLFNPNVFLYTWMGWSFIWGVLVGIGFWANGLSLVFSIPSIFILVIYSFARNSSLSRKIKISGWTAGGLGLALGASPWIVQAVNIGPDLFLRELLGSAVAVEQQPYLQRCFEHFLSFFLLGIPVILGFRPPWEVRWILVPVIPIILVVWVIGLTTVVRNKGVRVHFPAGYWGLWGILVVLISGFVFTSFGIDPSGRYFLPAAVPLALLVAGGLERLPKKWIGEAAILLVIFYQAWGTIESGIRFPPGLTTQFNPITMVDHQRIQDLIKFLREQGETRGYSNYWVSYPLAFESDETLIFTPQLPYHLDFRYTARDNRYLPYQLKVEQSNRAAYITTRHPQLDDNLRAGFTQRGILWKETQIGDYRVFYQLSAKINPVDLGIITP